MLFVHPTLKTVAPLKACLVESSDVQVEAAATLEPIRARLEFGLEVGCQPFCSRATHPIRARLEIACRGRPTLNPNPNP